MKITFRDSNNILDGNTISYDLAYEKYTKKDKFNDFNYPYPWRTENSGTLYDMNEKVKEPHPCCIGGGMDNGVSMNGILG